VNSKGEVYFVDGSNGIIGRVDAESKIAIAVDFRDKRTGAPPALISGIEFDFQDTLILVDATGKLIRKLDMAGQLTTIAGGTPFAGENAPAREALLNEPVDVAWADDGSVVVVDQRNNRLRRIGSDGNISTIAGTGEYGSSGDGGPATAATLSWPRAAALDSAGNIYVVDRETRIRRIDPDGVITAFAGADEAGDSGDGGPALQARFRGIVDIAVDSKRTVYVSDRAANRVRRIVADGTVETIAGTGERGGPIGVPGPGVLTAITPGEMAVDRDDSVLIDDSASSSGRLQRLYADGRLIPEYWPLATDLVSEEGVGLCGFRTIAAMVFDADGLIASDGMQICRLDREHRAVAVAGGRSGFAGDGGSGDEARFSRVQGLAVAPNGAIFVADTGNQRVRKITPR
jgi:trimeric autotransporter adhesin